MDMPRGTFIDHRAYFELHGALGRSSLTSVPEGIGTRGAIHARLPPLRRFRAIGGRTHQVTGTLIAVSACAKGVEKLRPPPYRFSKLSDHLFVSPKLGERGPTGIIGLTHLRRESDQPFGVIQGLACTTHGGACQRASAVELRVLRLTGDGSVEIRQSIPRTATLA